MPHGAEGGKGVPQGTGSIVALVYPRKPENMCFCYSFEEITFAFGVSTQFTKKVSLARLKSIDSL